VDYQDLNKETIKDKFPIPMVEELLDELHEACNSPKISNNLSGISCFFYKNFGRVFLNSIYHKLSTISTLVSNKPFSTIQSFILFYHFTINNISHALTYQFKK